PTSVRISIVHVSPATLRSHSLPRAILLAPVVFLAAAVGSAPAVDFVEKFEKEVRPVLEESCFKCHGPDKQKGGLRLDRKAEMLDSGEPAIAPGKSAESQLVARITTPYSQTDG